MPKLGKKFQTVATSGNFDEKLRSYTKLRKVMDSTIQVRANGENVDIKREWGQGKVRLID
jgi:hypothetical protein